MSGQTPTNEKNKTVLQPVEDSPLKEYEVKRAEVLKLLKQIEAGLEQHDRRASSLVGHHWGHVGDLITVIRDLTDIKDRLHLTGRYSNVS
jgi:hypothetical protein